MYRCDFTELLAQPKNAFLVGDRLYLRSVEPGDLPLIQAWANDPELRVLTGSVEPMSQQSAKAWLERVQADTNRIWFVVVLKDGDRVIGECGLLRMFHAWRNTDLSMIIGERDCWAQGYGTEALELLLDYAFGYLNFHRISIGVVGYNERGLRFWEKAGFQREGIQRDGYYTNHTYSDFVMLCMLEDDYRKRRGK